MIPFSLLDLAPICEGSNAGVALNNSRELAQHAERWGYRRFWLAEHHNMRGIASAATSIAIAHVAAGTSTIRVGSGGIMLPNHAPLIIAEQFGTLAALHPGRIDLGLGRAPGTDPLTARALRRNLGGDVDSFPRDVVELMEYFDPAVEGQAVQAVPGAGLEMEFWILGSSLFGAQLAAALGLPFAFASHFAPANLLEAFEIYRARFRPSAKLAKPHAMVAANVFAADDAEEARRLKTSLEQAFVNLRRGRPGPLPPPRDVELTPAERAMLDQALSCSVVGTAEDVQRGLSRLVERTSADELILTGQIFDRAARLRSFEIAAQCAKMLR